MRKRETYTAIALTAFALIITCLGAIYCSKKTQEETVNEEEVYTYLSPYVTLSPFDSYFRRAAEVIDYDWTLVAAIAYTESKFDKIGRAHV